MPPMKTERSGLLSAVHSLETFTGFCPAHDAEIIRPIGTVQCETSDFDFAMQDSSNLEWSTLPIVPCLLLFLRLVPPGIDITPNARIEFSPDRGGSSSQCDTGANAGLSPWRSAR